MEGIVFNIQRFSLHDGPGIRTTVFLKGCNLNCIWCHNPEGISKKPEVFFDKNKCILCGKCVEVCPNSALELVNGELIFNRSVCKESGRCIEACPSGSITWCGEHISVDNIMSTITQDVEYYKTTDGGITLSGGEPMLQMEFSKEILKRCKLNNIHTAVDTAGNIPWEDFERIIPFTDLFLYDLKVINREKHKEYTGVYNDLILNNLERLSDSFSNIVIRVPAIPSFNDSMNEMIKIADFIEKLKNIKLIELLKFHQMGLSKYESIGREYKAKDFNIIDTKKMEDLKEIFVKRNLVVRIS